jgi:hypothetical protein
VEYVVHAGGKLETYWTIDTTQVMPARSKGLTNSLPRVGVQVALNSDLTACHWYGRYAICSLSDHL